MADQYDVTAFPTFRDATIGFTDATVVTVPPPVSYMALPTMPSGDPTAGLATSFVGVPTTDALSSIDFGSALGVSTVGPASALGPLPTIPAPRPPVQRAPRATAPPPKPVPPTQVPRQPTAGWAGNPPLTSGPPPLTTARPGQRPVTVARPGQPGGWAGNPPMTAGRVGAPAGWAGTPAAPLPSRPDQAAPVPPTIVYQPARTSRTTTATPGRADVPVTPPSKGNGKKALGGAAAGTALLAKLGVLGKVLLFVGKLHLLGIVTSVAAYSLFFTWQFAVGLVALIFLHELGHYFAMRSLGIKTELPHLIPLVGGYTRMRSQPTTVAQEAWTALAGPVAGAAASGIALAVGQSYHQTLMLQLAYLSFVMTLFNLIPYGSLDGGRVAKALHPLTWFVILLFIVAALVASPSPFLGITAFVMMILAISKWSKHVKGGRVAYYAIGDTVRTQIAWAYLVTVIACAVGAYYAYTLLPHLT